MSLENARRAASETGARFDLQGSWPQAQGVGRRVMARVLGETFAQKFGGATNLQAFREPLGELFRRERLVFVALDLGVDGGRERAALQQDEGRGRAGEVRVALQAALGGVSFLAPM